MRREHPHAWSAAVAAVLLAALPLAGCDTEAIDRFVRDNMGEHQCVSYGDEGTAVVLKNHCKNLLPDEDAYNRCTVASPASGVEWAEYDLTRREVPAAVRRALERYRWITVNPSYTDLFAARMVASTQLKAKRADGVILLYLPHGPDKDRVIAGGGFGSHDAKVLEANRYVCGDWRSDHPEFRAALRRLILSVVRDPFNYEEEDATVLRPVVVSSFSYSGPETLKALHELESSLASYNILPKNLVYFFSVAPTFGMAKWRGRHGGVDLGRNDRCEPWEMLFETGGYGDTVFEVKSAGPADYKNALRRTTTPQCLIASVRDCVTAAGNGTYLTLDRGSDYVSDCKDPITMPFMGQEADYSRSGRAATTCFNYFPFSAARGAVECKALSDDMETGAALFENNVSGPRSIVVRPFYTTDRPHDLSRGRAMTTFYGEHAAGGHFGYWLNGTMAVPTSPTPEWDTMNPNFGEDLAACAAESSEADPACAACRDAGDWATGTERPVARVYWNARYKGIPVETDHFVYTVGPGDTCASNVTYRYGTLVNRFRPYTVDFPFDDPAEGQVHVTDGSGPSLIIDVNPPDPDGDAQVTRLALRSVRDDDVGPADETDVVFNDWTHPSPETRFVYTWPATMAYRPMYDGVDGVWMRLYVNVTFEDPITEETYESGDRLVGRVLIMKKCWGRQQSPRITVPDIRDWRVPGNIGPTSRLNLSFRAYAYMGEELPGGGQNNVASTAVEETSTRTALTDWSVGANGTTALMQWNELRYAWNVRESWCWRFPTDRVCGGTCRTGAGPCPNEATFTFMVTATNQQGGSFQRFYQVPVRRR